MASGLPDYKRGFDLAIQSLSEIINRPKYGGALLLPAVETVDANARTTIISVLGKGMIYGGYFAVDYTSIQEDSIAEVWVDGNTIADTPFDIMEKYGYRLQGMYSTMLTKFDNVNFIYGVGLSYGITFETSVELTYFEKNGTTPNVACALCFALV